jgi:hypothetical protein
MTVGSFQTYPVIFRPDLMASPELAPAIPSSVIASVLTSRQEAQVVDASSHEISHKKKDEEIDAHQWAPKNPPKRCKHELNIEEIKQLFDAVTFKLDIVLYRLRGYEPRNAEEQHLFTTTRTSVIDALSEAIKEVAQMIAADTDVKPDDE